MTTSHCQSLLHPTSKCYAIKFRFESGHFCGIVKGKWHDSLYEARRDIQRRFVNGFLKDSSFETIQLRHTIWRRTRIGYVDEKEKEKEKKEARFVLSNLRLRYWKLERSRGVAIIKGGSCIFGEAKRPRIIIKGPRSTHIIWSNLAIACNWWECLLLDDGRTASTQPS